MAGVITDLIDRVSDSSTGRPIIANLAAPGKNIGAASINLDAATNWTTSSAIHFSIYETVTIGSTVVKNPSTQTDWKGTLSGVAIGNLTLTGGTDRAYTAGAKVEITPTARYAKDLYDWAMTGHNQNGTHKAFTESNIVPTASLQDNAVSSAKVATGMPVQLVAANFSAMATTTAVIPSDDSIPQNTEGAEFMTLTFTPKSATNRLFIEVKFQAAGNQTPGDITAALFQDSIANAHGVGHAVNPSNGYMTVCMIGHDMVAGTTSPITFKVRAGLGAVGTLTFNGTGGNRRYGGASFSYIKITEYKA